MVSRAAARRHADKYSPGVRLRLEMGRYILAEDYLRAMHGRAALRRAVDQALEGLDALLLPALPIGAPPLGAATVDVGGHTEPVRAMMLRLTQLFNVTGHPAIAIPCGTVGTDCRARSSSSATAAAPNACSRWPPRSSVR